MMTETKQADKNRTEPTPPLSVRNRRQRWEPSPIAVWLLMAAVISFMFGLGASV